MSLHSFFPFTKNRYATLPKLETIVRKAARRHVLDVKQDSDSFILATDRAEIGLIKFKVFARSFDLWAYDANGIQLFPCVSIRGENWKSCVVHKVSLCIKEMLEYNVPDGHKIDLAWSDMMRQIAYAEEEMSKFPVPVTDRIGDGQAWMSPALSTAVYMNCIDERFV